MKVIRYILGVVFLMSSVCAEAQQLRKEAFDLLNLDYPGLEKVKAACARQQWSEASQALLDYYRHRSGVMHPDIDLKNIKLSKEEQKWADDALEHTFFVHKGYQPSYNYGKDINWQYWPVQDNELRWQLHRHKWFTPMGKAYRLSGDEKYAKEWAYQYMDWIKKNPLTQVKQEEYELVSAGEVKGIAENVRFAWRPLEVSNRLQDQTLQFLLFVSSPAFTPEFLTEFLVNYHRHALHILANYSAQGNHLLFEAQRMVYAGAFFPEFREASGWRESGISILNREIKKQVYPDGGQYELDPHYHLAAINIFCKALRMADVNGFRQEFPAEYVNTVKNMIEFYSNICFPDYSNPCFSDAKRGERSEEIRNYKDWLKIFPDCEWIRYYATEGREGSPLPYLSHGALTSGFFTFRNGWKQDATVMVVKAGPKGEWHCQPDNGTFELWYNGRNLFPDSGSYVYAGDAEVMKLRNWFRQTCVHNTLTLDEKNLQTTESVTKLWKSEGNDQVLVTENPHYDGLKHRRSVFFVDRTYFVIVDEAVGDAKGTVNLNYNLCEGAVEVNGKNNMLISSFEGPSNVKLQCFAEKKMTLKEKEGWRSVAYRQRVPRTAVSFNIDKKTSDAVRYITIIYLANNTMTCPTFKAKFLNKSYDEKGVRVEVSVNGKKRRLEYSL
ncbi:heparin-sulfate lyase HepC [Bacteroides heparinolyticus]|uniref:heparin-sulfate lyase HepC n=1 Tax=Prevotella heparinolytica TaxID=28113 RepID=UPI0023F99A90|nr:heparin-sulfate lyase HepC [Bacteroides heparinolyticus]MCI6212451.1 heparinase II/III family protein [Bacteroides heparinolyticus]